MTIIIFWKTFFSNIFFNNTQNKLTFKKKIQAITLIEERYSLQEVVAKLERNINYTTILWLYEKYKQIGNVDNKSLSGYLWKLTKCDK